MARDEPVTSMTSMEESRKLKVQRQRMVTSNMSTQDLDLVSSQKRDSELAIISIEYLPLVLPESAPRSVQNDQLLEGYH